MRRPPGHEGAAVALHLLRRRSQIPWIFTVYHAVPRGPVDAGGPILPAERARDGPGYPLILSSSKEERGSDADGRTSGFALPPQEGGDIERRKLAVGDRAISGPSD